MTLIIAFIHVEQGDLALPPSNQPDYQDVVDSVHARLADEAGYLGPHATPLIPSGVDVAVFPNGLDDELVHDILDHGRAVVLHDEED